MTVVRPPSFPELVKIYGSPKKAVLHLLETGFSPETISWKMAVPYYLIWLYKTDIEFSNPFLFINVTDVYERLALLRSKRGKETELAKFFKNPDLKLEVKTRFALGRIVDGSLRIGPSVIERALSTATGSTPKQRKEVLRNYGEYGEVAYLLLREKVPRLTVEEVYESIKMIPKLEKVKERDQLITSLLEVCTPKEGKYLVRLLLLDLKLGYHQRTVIHAAARAYKVPPMMIEGVCSIIGLAEGIMLASKGALALEKIKLRPGQFLKPQLAHIYQPEKVSYPAIAEQKLDGSRLQVHKWGSRVWLYSRRGLDKTQTLPEIEEAAWKFKVQNCIIDSEVVALDSHGNFQSFQILLQRTVPSELSDEELKKRREEVAVTFRAFDIIYLNGRDLSKLPLSERRKYLQKAIPHENLIQGEICMNEVELMSSYESALRQGYEGIIVKNLNAPYEFGHRSYNWLKIKPERDTIDCTLVKAFHGKGRRAGLYSSFLMAIRNSKEKKLYSIGKVSNLSEETMEHLTSLVQNTKKSEDKEGILITPSIVVEVTYQEIQIADEDTSGFALRVPKVVRFRPDKSVEHIDTLEKIKSLFELQYER